MIMSFTRGSFSFHSRRWTTMAVIDLNKQTSEIIALAQKIGEEQKFLFINTFKRY